MVPFGACQHGAFKALVGLEKTHGLKDLFRVLLKVQRNAPHRKTLNGIGF